MNELALFAGAGGGILGGLLLGWKTVCAVELDPYAASVLVARQNDGILPPFPIWDDVCTFDGRPWHGLVDVVSGGFPCQDISTAGRGAGITGERSGLWKEFARIVGEVRPRFAFVENSPALTIRGLDVVLGDLAEIGYDAEWCVLGADDCGAPHHRKRIWILAYAKGGKSGEQTERERRENISRGSQKTNVADTPEMRRREGDTLTGGTRQGTGAQEKRYGLADCGDVPDAKGEQVGFAGQSWIDGSIQDISNAAEPGLEGSEPAGERPGERGLPAQRRGWWESEPDVGRIFNGLAKGMDLP